MHSLPRDERQSLQNVDILIEAKREDGIGDFRYILVEASSTVTLRDAERALRNSRHLEALTRTHTVPVVSGVQLDGLPETDRRIERMRVKFHQIEPKDYHPR